MKSATVLVVDDIPLMRTMLVKYVRSLGLRVLQEEMGITRLDVLEAENGRRALEILADRPVDVIFLDLMMPEMDGLAFLEARRERELLAEIPVIVCSALGDKKTVERAGELGATSYIVKPFSLSAVEERFREALDLARERVSE